MSKLKDRFLEGVAGRLAALASALDELEVDPRDPARADSASRHFHRFAGAGATFGFPLVTALGRDGERLCQAVPPDGVDVAGARRLAEAIQLDLSRGGSDAGEAPRVLPVRRADVLVVDDDLSLLDTLGAFLEQEGMAVRRAVSAAEAIRSVTGGMPEAILVDVLLPDGSGYALVEELRDMPGGDRVPILIISAKTAFLDRVEAIRCGADGYFVKPIDHSALARRILHLQSRAAERQLRVLSVEDDPDQASFLGTILAAAGYETRLLADPLLFESELLGFQPDLVLMDVRLPGVTGYELVRYLRQDDRWAALPVLFLSTERQPTARIEAIRAGGDELLSKPIAPAHLLSAVAARIERAGFLRSLLSRDGLTGLLTHSAFFEQARIAVAHKTRSPHREYVLAMLDVDHFKEVNDRHGHPTGDHVLASLASLLKRRLRVPDVIGRYGGDEVSIVLEDLGEEDAVRLLGRIQSEFQDTPHATSSGSSFQVSFSAGVAALLPGMDTGRWVKAADEALYCAKAAGRARAVAAGSVVAGIASGHAPKH